VTHKNTYLCSSVSFKYYFIMATLHIYSESLQIWWIKNGGKKNYHRLLYTDGKFLIMKWEISVVFHGMGRQGVVSGILWLVNQDISSAVSTYSSKWCTDTQLLIQFNIMQFPPTKKVFNCPPNISLPEWECSRQKGQRNTAGKWHSCSELATNSGVPAHRRKKAD
jgi:hypothetical protein